MKLAHIRPAIAAVALVALNFLSTPAAHAAKQLRADAIAVLTAGTWHLQGRHFSMDATFDAKGNVTLNVNRGGEKTMKWKASTQEITIIYSYYEEKLLFPIDPKGTKGVDAWGDEFTATMKGGPNVVIPTPTPTPATGLAALQTPTPAADFTPAPRVIINQLSDKKWTFIGQGWTEVRSFESNGTVNVEGKATTARWQQVGQQIVITFPDHKDVLYLPVDPKGMRGTDAYGKPCSASIVDTAANNAPPPVPGSSTPAPAGGTTGGSSYYGSTTQHTTTFQETPPPKPSVTPTPAP